MEAAEKYIACMAEAIEGGDGEAGAEMAEAATKVIQPLSPLPAKVGTSAATKQTVAEIRERAGD